jgi:hypothetical protein
MEDCTNNQEQHKRCINEGYIGACLNCKRFYVNLPEEKEDLYREKSIYREAFGEVINLKRIPYCEEFDYNTGYNEYTCPFCKGHIIDQYYWHDTKDYPPKHKKIEIVCDKCKTLFYIWFDQQLNEWLYSKEI